MSRYGDIQFFEAEEIEPQMPSLLSIAFTSLGWMNGWRPDDPAWAELKKCSDAGHVREDIDIGPPHRGIDHRVRCYTCGFEYHYDCSD